jgi:hypothetical protein
METTELQKKQNQMVPDISPQEEFEQAVIATLDLNSWSSGENLSELYARLEYEVRDAIADEEIIRGQIRNQVFPKIASGRKSVPASGFHRFSVEMIEKAHTGLLFNGGVEGCDGIVLVHDTLPLTITQIGVCLTSYQGEQGSYAHRLYRRDFKLRGEDPVQEALDALEQRKNRGGFNNEDGIDNLSSLARRGVMAYAERAILLEKSNSRWRMGHGHPTPYELFSGHWAHRRELTETALKMMRRMVLEHQKFVFVPSAPGRRELLTLGNALGPLEYLILIPIKEDLINRIKSGGAREPMRSMMLDFAEEVGSEIIIGLYRVSRACPPHIFYAHKDHAQTAALIAMADGTLQEHRGFPMLIDIADNLCRMTFGADGFISSVQEAYAESGQPFRYLTERETRR